jgi:hypothetical protein
MKLAIETRDKHLLEEIFNEPEIAKAKPISLGEGVVAKGLEWRFNKAEGFSDVAIVLITAAVTIPATVAANLITQWILGRLKGHVERVMVEKIEISFDESQIKKNRERKNYGRSRFVVVARA